MISFDPTTFARDTELFINYLQEEYLTDPDIILRGYESLLSQTKRLDPEIERVRGRNPAAYTMITQIFAEGVGDHMPRILSAVEAHKRGEEIPELQRTIRSLGIATSTIDTLTTQLLLR